MRKKHIADQHGGGRAKLFGRGFLAVARVGLVENVVVHKRGKMNELDHGP